MAFSAARELFEDARQASFELWRHDLKYNAMESRALSTGGSSDVKVAAGSIRDGMAPVDAMVDYEAMMERREGEWCRAIDRAMAVLYGTDWEHGVALALSIAHAEVLDCIYIQRLSMASTADRIRWSERKCHNLRKEAFAYVDSVGIERAMAGCDPA